MQRLKGEVDRLTLGAEENSEPNLLADIICQVPSVRDLLPCNSKKAVMSCSRQCRSLMHNVVTAVMINKLNEMTAISSSTWPSLGVVVIQNQRLHSVGNAIAVCKLQIMAAFGFHQDEDDMHFVVLVLQSSTDQQCRDAAFRTQLESLSRIICNRKPWRTYKPYHLEWLTKFAIRQSQMDSNSLVQLLSMEWPRLRDLDLSYTTLDAAAVDALAKGNWPELYRISLNCSALNTAGIAQELWPRVKHLYLRGASFFIPDAILAAFVAAWPKIWFLSLQAMRFGAEFGVALARIPARLRTLHLHSVSLDRDILSGLTVVSWPLTHLQLQNSRFGADAMSILILYSFPQLRKLDLSYNQLDEPAAQHLMKGKWPLLERLNISHYSVDDRAMEALAQGQWTELTWLLLQGNPVNAVGAAMLLKARWPKLEYLQLDHAAMSAATWALLSLHPGFLAKHKGYYRVPRLLNYSSGERLLWNELDIVVFGDSQKLWSRPETAVYCMKSSIGM